jgi:hypothetical protein
MAEAMLQGNNHGHRQGHHKEDLQRKIERFIHLKAPTFDYSDDPLEANDWLKVIETKLGLTNYTDEECVALTAHRLIGSVKAW